MGYAIAVGGLSFSPHGWRFVFAPPLLASLLLPMMIPVAASAVALAISSRCWNWPWILLAGTGVWIAYLAVLLLWISSIEDRLGQSYASISLLPWLFNWLLIPFGYGIAQAMFLRRLGRR